MLILCAYSILWPQDCFFSGQGNFLAGNGDGESSATSSNDQVLDQSGAGQFTSLSNFNLDYLATLVAKKITKEEENSKPTPRPTIINWQSYEKSQPTNAVTFDEVNVPPLPYDQNVVKSDLNDSMDVRRVLSLVPKKSRANAVKLLDSFEHRPEEMTFSSSGVIYANQNSIPNSNIFKFFPLLFKKKRPNLPGFLDFVNQIEQMGLAHLIVYQPKHVDTNALVPFQAPKVKSHMTKESHEKPKNWWYIGP